MSINQNVATAARRLQLASETLTPCVPIRDLLDDADIDAAYAVQQQNLLERYAGGRRRVGRKIGLTSDIVQRQLGVGQPDCGSLLDDMRVPAGSTVRYADLLQPKVEAEIAFTLKDDIANAPGSIDDIAEAIESATAAIEIVDSRVAGWDISIIDTIADNASSGMFVLSDVNRSIDGLVLPELRMSMCADGIEVSTGSGAACLGNPLNAVRWLAMTALRNGDPLRAGEIILSGALGAMVTVHGGEHFRASITGFAPVDVTFTAKESEHD
jgi:2-keto-4-pentenoate hydratase